MSEAAIRKKIFETIVGVPGISEVSSLSEGFGWVHKYERWCVDWAKFLRLFQTPTGHIFGCEIRRASFSSLKLSTFEDQVTHGYQIKMYLAVQDAEQSELTFNERIEALTALFRHDHTLGGTCLDAGPVSAETIEERTFGSVLCHYAELRLPATEIQ